MSWFTNVFQKKKTKAQVQAWLASELQGVQEAERAWFEEAAYFAKLQVELKEKLAELENAVLRNPQIDAHAVQVMEGNRESFMRIGARLVQEWAVPKTAEEVGSFSAMLEGVGIEQAKCAQVLEHFFKDELRAVQTCLNKAEQRINGYKKIRARVQELQVIEVLLGKCDAQDKELVQVGLERQEVQSKIVANEQEQSVLQRKKEELRSSKEYLKIREELQLLSGERQRAQEEIVEVFHPIAELIKKYAYKVGSEQLGGYAQNALQSLIEDYSLAILDQVNGMRVAVVEGSILVRDKERVLEVLQELNKEHLARLVHKYGLARKNEGVFQKNMVDLPQMKAHEALNAQKELSDQTGVALKNYLGSLKDPNREETNNELGSVLEKENIKLV